MDRISSSADLHRQYGEVVRELQERVDQEVDASERKSDVEKARLSRNLNRQLADQQNENEKTLLSTKENYDDALTRERELAKRDVQKLKKELYDQKARTAEYANTGITPESARSLVETQEQIEAANQQRLEQADSAYSRKTRDQEVRHRQDLEDSTERFRDSAERSYRELAEAQKRGDLTYREELERQYRRLNDQVNQDKIELENLAFHRVEDADRAAERSNAEVESSSQRRTADILRSQAERAAKTVLSARDAAAEQTHQLREQLHHVQSEFERSHQVDGDATSKAVREVVDQARREQQLHQTSHDFEKSKLRMDVGVAERHAEQINAERERARGQLLSDIVTAKQKDFHTQTKTLEKTFEKSEEQAKQLLSNEREAASRRTAAIAEAMAEERAVALADQSKAYGNAFSNQRKSFETTIRQLEEEKHKMLPGGSVAQFEEKVRDSVSQEYAKKLDAEHSRNQASVTSLKDSYGTRLADARIEAETASTRAEREKASEVDRARKDFTRTLVEEQHLRKTQLEQKQQDADKELVGVHRKYGRMLELQKKAYEEAMDNLKLNVESKISERNEEAQFKERMAIRAAAERHADTARDAERRLAEQRDEFKMAMENLIAETGEKLHQSDKALKTELEKQQKFYERQMALNEEQFQQRQKSSTRNYGQQIEELRRTNARLAAKKG